MCTLLDRLLLGVGYFVDALVSAVAVSLLPSLLLVATVKMPQRPGP
jgi:hypothetical protein